MRSRHGQRSGQLRVVAASWGCALLLSALGVVGSLSACGRPREVEQRKRLLAVAPQQQQIQVQQQKAALFGTDGKLLPSDDVVSGLRMPRGLKLEFKLPRRWVYDTTVNVERLREYFGPRLLTGSVTPAGGAVRYGHAQARDSQGEIYFDVVIGAKAGHPGHNFVDIREYPPVPVKWPTDEEVRRQLAEAAKRGG